MQVADIAAKTSWMDKTSRRTNCLNPVYEINGMVFKDDKYTRPTRPRDLMEDNSLLQTADIAGATQGWRKSLLPRREYRNTNYIGDIQGAFADSIKKGIVTKREVHPLCPVYQSLDPGELLLPLIPPLIPEDMVKIPTISMAHVTHNIEGENDPVQFTEEVKFKASTNQEFALDLSRSMGNTGTMGNTGGTMGNTGGMMYSSSGRGASGGGAETGFGASGTAGFSNRTGGSSRFKSPAASARLTPKQKTAMSARNADIEAVRALG